MKLPLLISLVGLAIGLDVPIRAQEKESVDPEVRQEIEAVLTKYEDAFNKNDAVAIAALYTADAAEVFEKDRAGGSACGREAIQQVCLPLRIGSRQTVAQARSGVSNR
jgi:hypothetical protein